MDVYRFRDCLLNTTERSVIKDSEHIELTTRTFDLLQYLIENAGQVVTKDDILGNVWRGNFVEESNLPVHISKIRRSLGENRNDRFVETVQGIGYRFVAPVQHAEEGEWNETQKTCRVRRNGDLDLGRPILNSIAVLPLQNESGDPNIDYLVDGLTEGLINGLSHIPGLKVIARNTVFRYRNKDVNLQDVGELLGVSRILTGRMRVAGTNVVIGVELVRAADGVQLWGDQYDRSFDEIIKTKQEILSVLIARLAGSNHNQDSELRATTENAESYRLYLMGMHMLGKRTAPETYKAIEYFRRSVSACPTNVHSYVGIAEGHNLLHAYERTSRMETLLAMQPILETLSKSNESLDVVQEFYGKLKLGMYWNAEAAEGHFRAALVLNANSVVAHSRLAEVLAVRGKGQEAVFHANQVVALDPVSLGSLRQLGRVFYILEQNVSAVAYLSDAYEMEPQDPETQLLLGAALAELGEHKRAIDLLTKSYSLHSNVETLSMIGYVMALASDAEGARETLVRIKSEHPDWAHPINLARVYIALGEKETAYKFLEEAFQNRSTDFYGLAIDPRWKSIRLESRFQRLVRRVEMAATLMDNEHSRILFSPRN